MPTRTPPGSTALRDIARFTLKIADLFITEMRSEATIALNWLQLRLRATELSLDPRFAQRAEQAAKTVANGGANARDILERWLESNPAK